MEGIADCQYLIDQDSIQTVPPALAEIYGLNSHDESPDEVKDKVQSVFSENPFCGSRVRQSGTMGNDLYVKNRWLLMGVIDSVDSSGAKTESASKRIKMSEFSSNSKVNNPALI
jgi:hypothetical protein